MFFTKSFVVAAIACTIGLPLSMQAPILSDMADRQFEGKSSSGSDLDPPQSLQRRSPTGRTVDHNGKLNTNRVRVKAIQHNSNPESSEGIKHKWNRRVRAIDSSTGQAALQESAIYEQKDMDIEKEVGTSGVLERQIQAWANYARTKPDKIKGSSASSSKKRKPEGPAPGEQAGPPPPLPGFEIAHPGWD